MTMSWQKPEHDGELHGDVEPDGWATLGNYTTFDDGSITVELTDLDRPERRG